MIDFINVKAHVEVTMLNYEYTFLSNRAPWQAYAVDIIDTKLVNN